MKSEVILKIVCCVFFIDIIAIADWSSTEVSHSFKCYTPHNNDNKTSVVWSFQNKSTNSDTPLFLCSTLSNKCDVSFDNVLEFYSANLTTNTSIITSVFTIKSVKPFQNDTMWLCRGKNQDVFIREAVFDLLVFSAPETPTCEEATLISKDIIEINCLTLRVFPKSVCSFYVTTNNTTADLKNGSINLTHEANVTTGYYKTLCSYTVTAEVIGPGTHIFYVIMYPDISSTISNDMKKRSQNTSSIVLTYPQARLGSDCMVQRYINENETSNCTCYDGKTSFLPTQITWSALEMQANTNYSTLSFTAKRPGTEKQTFTCNISNALNWNDAVIFYPNVSYPPSVRNFTVNHQETDICDTSTVFISGSCLISNSNPEPIVHIDMNNDSLGNVVKNNSEYFFATNITAGSFNVSCSASNAIFAIKSVLSEQIIITGPPQSPKMFKVNLTGNISPIFSFEIVRERELLKCESKGGFPKSKNLTLKCEDVEVHSFDSDQVDLTFTSTNFTYFKNYTCECIVEHTTKCLIDNKIKIQVEFSRIQPVPEDEFQNFELAIGLSVAVGCTVLILASVLIICKIRYGRFKLKSSDLKEKLVVNEDVYFIKDGESTSDISMYPEYTNVVTTMASAMEAPKNFKK